ncbi:MAG: iron-sulfur cluster carrier protein ApbC [Gammaproteobacteria bacterium]
MVRFVHLQEAPVAENWRQALSSIKAPIMGEPLSSVPWVKGTESGIILDWPYAAQSLWPTLEGQIRAALNPQTIQSQLAIKSRDVQNNLAPIPGIKNIIAVASGKGGVGKSTVTANLARALQQEGARVGVLDADIYGPSQAMMLGAGNVHPEALDQRKMKPIDCAGIQTMSIAYLLQAQDTAMIWRGPMVSGALMQMLQDTVWGELDYLVIDLPPGTGDIQLTLAQKVPVTGAVIVTTPQDIALMDARKAYAMFRKTGIDVLGIVENMAMHHCSACGHEEAIFGEGGGERMARQYELPLLASLPLDARIRQDMDEGKAHVSPAFIEMAHQVGARLALKRENFASKFGTVRVL